MITKTLSRVCRLVFSGAAVASCLIATAFAQEDDLLGTWSCNLSVEDPEVGAVMTGDFEQTYDSDGTYERAGEMKVVIAAFEVDVTVSIKEAGSWRFVDSTTLGETISDVEFSSTEEAPSQMEQMMLQQMQAAADAQSTDEQTTKITSLTATAMEVEDDEGVAMACQKA